MADELGNALVACIKELYIPMTLTIRLVGKLMERMCELNFTVFVPCEPSFQNHIDNIFHCSHLFSAISGFTRPIHF